MNTTHHSPLSTPSAAPWLFTDAHTGQLVSCAWCEREHGGTPPPEISHGICPRHFRIQMAALDRQLPESAVAA